MIVKTYRAHNEEATLKAKPIDIIEYAIKGVDLVAALVENLKPSLQEDNLRTLKNLSKNVVCYRIDFSVFNPEEIMKNYNK